MAKRTKPRRKGPLDSQRSEPVDSNPDGGVDGGDAGARDTWEKWRTGRTHAKDWRSDASENYDFVAGHQWAEEDLARLREEMRTPIVFNRMQAVINAVSGFQINSRQEVTYLPREPDESGESGIAEVDTAAAKYFRQECDAEDEESDQFRDTLITGMGWTEHNMDYDNDPDGMMTVKRVDCLQMVWDPAAERPNLVDRGWDIRGKWWDKDIAKEKWPDHNFDMPIPSTYDEHDMDSQPPVDRLEASFYRAPGVGEQAQLRKGKVFILEHTWHESEAFFTMVNPTTGKTEDVEPPIHSKFQSMLEERGYPKAKSVKRMRRKFKRRFVHAKTTLEEDDAPCPEMFHYQCITGFRDRNKNIWFGLGNLMKDPQRWSNKWLSQFLHLLNTNVKTGVWYEKGAVDRVSEIEEKVAKPGFVIGVNNGFLDKIKKEEPAPIPNDAFNLMQYAISSVRDVTGANLEILGQQTNDQPGVVENARKQSAMNVLAPFFSGQRQYLKNAGRLTLYFVRNYLSDDRWIRIAGTGRAKFVQLARNDANSKYDIIVDDAPMAPSVKESVWGSLNVIIPALLQSGIPIPPDILDYIPGVPSTLAEKWKQMVAQKMQQGPPADPKVQLQQQKLQLDAAKHQSDVQESQNQDRLDEARLAFDKFKMETEQRMQQAEQHMKMLELALEQKKLGIDQHNHQAELGHELVMAHHDRQHEREQAQLDRAAASAESALDRQHSSSEGAAERDTKTKLAKSKPKPGGKNAK